MAWVRGKAGTRSRAADDKESFFIILRDPTPHENEPL